MKNVPDMRSLISSKCADNDLLDELLNNTIMGVMLLKPVFITEDLF